MIKMIKRGTRDTRECDKCGCLFSFDEEDIAYVNEMNIRKYVKCPQCSHKTILEQSREPFNNKRCMCDDCIHDTDKDSSACAWCGDGGISNFEPVNKEEELVRPDEYVIDPTSKAINYLRKSFGLEVEK